MAISLLACFIAATFASTFETDIPDDHHAVFADKHGVFMLDDKQMILDQIKNGLTPRKIAPNSDIQNIFNRRRLSASTSQAEALLDIHNEYRSDTSLGNTPGEPKATNINTLLWDPYLAKVAQDYSALCRWQHNDDPAGDLTQYMGQTEYEFDADTVSVGENIYYTTLNASTANIVYGIQLYYEEYEYYTFNNGTSGCCDPGEQCGHYTQVVWHDTRYVGCGYTVCNGLAGAVGSGRDVLFKVCNYFPAGNYVGQSPYYSGCTCDNCPSDRKCDSSGLCAGCGSVNYDYCTYNRYSNCDDFISYCPSNGCKYPIDLNNNTYCVDCRGTCETCPDSLMTGRSTCVDGTASDISGNVDGRDITSPESATDFTGETCSTDNTITVCPTSGGLGKKLNVMVILGFLYFVVLRI